MVRKLPARLEIRYAVIMGDKGFKAGRATYTWVARDGRYSLVNVIEATGLVSLFVRGRIVQVSEGHIDASGLKPEEYWLQRGHHRDSARLDWTNHLLILDKKGGEKLPEGTQDLLSFAFQLALTVRPEGAAFELPVTDGRKLKRYSFRHLGVETLHLADGDHMVQHLQGSRAGEGTLDVWLDDENGIPLKIRVTDQDGEVKTMQVEQIRGQAD
jgi:hypothetical protein